MTIGDTRRLKDLSTSQFAEFVYSGRVWSGEDDVNKKRENGYNRTTVYEHSRTPKGMKCYYLSSVPNATCGTMTTGPIPSSWTNNDDIAVRVRLVNAIKASEFKPLVSLAEGAQTVGMIIDVIRFSKRQFISLLRKKRFQKRRKLNSDDVAAAYLTLVFGIQPAMLNAFEAFKAWTWRNESRVQRYQVSHRTRHSVRLGEGSNVVTVGSHQRIDTLRAQVERDSLAHTVASWVSPAQVLWELTPWSWLFDYWLPVGDYLTAVELANLQARVSRTTVEWVEAEAINNMWPGYIDLYGNGARRVRTKSIVRTPNVPLAVPLPGFIDVPDGLSPRRIANVIAAGKLAVSGAISKYTR